MSESLTLTSRDRQETDRIAAGLVPFLRSGDVLLLSGDLGAGKTAFTQGLARAAGVIETVTSPTFTLLHAYPTAIGLDLLHVDVYRLETTGAIADLALPELVEDDAFAVIEWGERATGVLGPDHLSIAIAADAAGLRHIVLRPSGQAWLVRWPEVVVGLSSVVSRTRRYEATA